MAVSKLQSSKKDLGGFYVITSFACYFRFGTFGVRNDHRKKTRYFDLAFWLTAFGAVVLLIAIIMIFVSIVNCLFADQIVSKKMIEYNALNGAQQKQYIVGDIISYNKYVLDVQKYHDSPWLGWFFAKGEELLPMITNY